MATPNPADTHAAYFIIKTASTSNSSLSALPSSSAASDLTSMVVSVPQTENFAGSAFVRSFFGSHATKIEAGSTPPRSLAIAQQYLLLASSLKELAEAYDEGDGRIEKNVFTDALYIASALSRNQKPAPKVFSHGSKSVVFTWNDGPLDRYLTISDGRMSALISKHKKIIYRVDIKGGNEKLKIVSLMASGHTSDQPILTGVESLSSDFAETSI